MSHRRTATYPIVMPLLFSCLTLCALAPAAIAETVATPTLNPGSSTFTSSVAVSISCTTTVATIRYTTNGTEVSATSPVYTAPLTLTATTTVKARGYKDGLTPGAMAVGTYTKSFGVVATPVMDPIPPRSFTGSIVVSLSCATPAATIRYTKDGTEPSSTSAIYASPLTLTATTMLKARGAKEGYTPSAVATGIYTKSAVAVPTFDPIPPQTFTNSIQVTIRCATVGATIRSTTDGTEPGATSAIYTSPLMLTATTTIRARGYKDGYSVGAVATGVYTRSIGVVAAPTFDPIPPQVFRDSIRVTINCATAGATIRYTTDGTEVTPLSPLYAVPLTFTATTTLKARGYKDGFTPSIMGVGVYSR